MTQASPPPLQHSCEEEWGECNSKFLVAPRVDARWPLLNKLQDERYADERSAGLDISWLSCKIEEGVEDYFIQRTVISASIEGLLAKATGVQSFSRGTPLGTRPSLMQLSHV